MLSYRDLRDIVTEFRAAEFEVGRSYSRKQKSFLKRKESLAIAIADELVYGAGETFQLREDYEGNQDDIKTLVFNMEHKVVQIVENRLSELGKVIDVIRSV